MYYLLLRPQLRQYSAHEGATCGCRWPPYRNELLRPSLDHAAQAGSPLTPHPATTARSNGLEAAAAPPSSVMNSRRFMLTFPSQSRSTSRSACHTSERRVLRADLNCSEQTGLLPARPIPQMGGASTIHAFRRPTSRVSYLIALVEEQAVHVTGGYGISGRAFWDQSGLILAARITLPHFSVYS